MRSAFIIVLVTLMAGCASGPGGPAYTPAPDAPASPTPAVPGVNLTGYSLAFRNGYADGCGSVSAASKRDEARFKSDKDYAQGWRDGNDICKRRK